MKRVLLLLAIVAALAPSPDLFAHGVSTSYSRIRIDGRRVSVQFTCGLLDFHEGPKIDSDNNGQVSEDEFKAGIGALIDAIEKHYGVMAPEEPASVTTEKAEMFGPNAARIDFVYVFNHDLKDLRITSNLHLATQADHQHLLAYGDGDNARQGVLSQKKPTVDIDLDGQTSFEVFFDFIVLGVEHIITGYDHLAFLAGLLLTTTTMRSLIKVVTSFTAAHSITLALATFNIVTIPSRLIESLIALSIAYVAIENFTGKTLVNRWKVTFMFGLVHGFGFSNVLKEMELTRNHLAISLFSFNIGVEAGQLFFVAIVFPLVILAMKSKWKEQLLAATSLVIMGLGFYWFVERAFLS